MRNLAIVLLVALLGLPSVAPAQTAGLDRAEAIGPFLNGALPPRTPRPSSGSWRLVNAFPSLTFIDPVQMLPVPLSNRLMVVEKAGRLVVFQDSPTVTTKTVLIDIRSQVESTHDSGMVGLAFHPEFGVAGSPNRHYLYVYYRFTVQKSDTDRAYCRLSRFTWDPATNAIAPSSEYVLINQYDRHNWHNGGGIFFGTDKFLYISVGDEGGANDQYNSGQRMDTGLLAGVLRIDVDRDPARSHPIRRQPRNPATPPSGWPNSYSQGYYIPNDNPWQSPTGALLEEFYAIGLRSPHRMTQDRVTGDIWVGDVGQGTQEEVSRVVRGGNLQWPYREGSVSGPKSKPSPLIGTDVTPVYSYGRTTGGCVIGGYVYRGALHPELRGKYIFGDHVSNAIWSLDATGSSPVVTRLLTLSPHGSGPKNGMGSFGIDSSGEVYVLSLAGTNLDGGRIYRIEKSTEGVPEPPQLLSQTGAFTNLATLTAAPGLIPYGVNQALWSDGAGKERWIAIPNDGTPNTAAERIVWSEEGNWNFPTGTVLVKHFAYPGRRLETRFLVNGDDQTWYGFTYRWRNDGSDAELLPGDPVTATVTVGNETRQWHFPGRNECGTCHSPAAGRVLGVKTRQLNGDFFYATTGRTANQITTLNRLGFFTTNVDETRLGTMLTSRAQNDPNATLERRARSYLDTNCSHCHQPAAPTQAAFDARLEIPPFYQNLINVLPNNNLGVTGARLVSPGQPDLSVAHRRLGSLAPGVAMPPIAKNLVDTEGLKLLTDWINSLDPAVAPTGPVTGTPPRDHTAPILTLTHGGGSATVTGPFSVTVTTPEAIRGLTPADIVITNGTVSAVTGSGTSWTLAINPTAAGAGSLSIPADRIVDLNGNANPASAVLPFTFTPPTGPANLLTGGDFESGLNGWDNGGGVTVSTASRTGLGAAALNPSAYIVRNIPVEALKNYLFSGWTRATVAGVRAEAGLTFWDENGVWIHDRTVALTPTTAWSKFELSFTAPVGARQVSVWVLANSSGGLSVDDLRITAEGAGEPRPVYGPNFTNLLSNGGFESGLATWDAGGSVVISPSARTGSASAALGGGAFVVQTRTVRPGELLALAGSWFTRAPGSRVEAGFSFYDASGTWITDRTILLPDATTYQNFLVDTAAPERAATVTLWVWHSFGDQVTVDDLVLFRPDETPTGEVRNLLSNGGFEGSLAPWDTGGSAVTLVTPARTGTGAARIGGNSFVVQSFPGIPGERYLLSGHHLNATGGTAPREAGFSFWGTSGQWLGDAVAVLPNQAAYSAFSVEGLVPTGAASFSVWVWTGEGGNVTVDDLSLTRVETAAGGGSITANPEDAVEQVFLSYVATDMTMLSLKSDRSIAFSGSDPLGKDDQLALALGTSRTVYSNGWQALGGGVGVRGLGSGEKRSLITTVQGAGILSANWSLASAAPGTSLRLLVDGVERGRWTAAAGDGRSRTVAAKVIGAGLHTVEFRLENRGIQAATNLSATLRDLSFQRGHGPLQPDLAVASGRSAYVGDKIFNPNAAGQQLGVRTKGRTPARFSLRWSNRASAHSDGARISGAKGDRFHQMSYFETRGSARSNVTSTIVAGSWESPTERPGGSRLLQGEVRRAKPRGLKRYQALLRATSLLDAGRSDAVKLRVDSR